MGASPKAVETRVYRARKLLAAESCSAAALVATFNPATRELTIPTMPAHASFVRSYHQPAGGPATLAGVSSTGTVSVVGITPPTPGVTYQLWLVGENSRGQRPESNKVSFTA